MQGQQAPAELLAAVEAAEARLECDVLLLVRGGGSFEDLDAFNDERLARQLARCTLPVVSGVGHESDFTICDFVADVRAPTPTAAAELVSTDRRESLQRLRHQRVRLQQVMQRQLERLEQRLDMAERLLRSPARQLQAHGQRLEQLAERLQRWPLQELPRQEMRVERLAERLQRAMTSRLAESWGRWQRAADTLRPPSTAAAGFRLAQAEQRLAHAARGCWQRAATRLEMAENSLALISPLAVLGRGYALVRDAEGRLLTTVDEARPGGQVEVRLQDGSLQATVDMIISNHSSG